MKDKQKRLITIFVTVLFIVAVFFSIKSTKKEHNGLFTDYFDTVTEITVVSKNEKPLSDCEKYIKKMDSELSADNRNGLIYRSNNGENVDFDKDTRELIKYAEAFMAENSDYFSIRLDPLIKAWDIKNNI